MPRISAKIKLASSKKSTPTCIGSGFVALDWICLNKDASPTQTLAGGSCGNVLSILAYLGWKAIPIARLKNDSPAETVLRDLEKWKVVTDFVKKDSKGSTPVVIQRILKAKDGIPFHKFEWRFPVTGERLPSYRPLPKKLAVEFLPQLPKADFFYMDRAEPSSLLIAKELKAKGATIFFEPSGIRDPRLFSECLAVADIVKYSIDRLCEIPPSASLTRPILEIRTLGDLGLEYRLKVPRSSRSNWRFMSSLPVHELKDACGAGDWCSAGLIHILACDHANLSGLTHEQVQSAIRYGQALASINCQFEGARGAMYNFSKYKTIANQVEALQSA